MFRNGHEQQTSLHKISTRVTGGKPVPKDTWRYQSSQTDMPPYNRILEVIELDVIYEDRNRASFMDEESAVQIPPRAKSEPDGI